MSNGPVNLSQGISKIWEIYTDGSRNSELRTSGTGIIIYCNGVKMWSNSYALGDRSVYQTETYGIKKAALFILDPQNRQMIHNDEIIIYTDSQVTVKALDSNFIKSRLLWDTIMLLNEAIRYSGVKNITISWIKGHAGYMGNEEADRLAAIGASLPIIASDQPNISRKQLNGIIKGLFYAWWDRVWLEERHNKLTRCRQTRMFFPHLRPEFSFDLVNSHREVYSMLVQLITGHNYANRHQFIIDSNNGLVDPIRDKHLALCSLCGEDEESSLHLLAECSALMNLRLQVFGEHQLAPPFINLKKSQLVCFLRGAPIDALKFFTEGEQKG